MYSLSDIKQVHLESTTYCNASCPQCARNNAGGLVNPNLPLKHLTLEDCKKIFTEDFLKQLQLVFMCGNYGDPLMSPYTLDILEYFKSVNPKITLGMHTNASGRNKDWWERLAKVVSYCKFGIDGLEDTNHIYRKNTDWNTITQNIKYYVNAGGVAHWDFIVFKHNQHQVEEAFQLSKDLGFKMFNVKKTERFYNPSIAYPNFKKEVLNKNFETEYKIEPPDDPRYINHPSKKLTEFVKSELDFKAYLETTEIKCTAIKNKQIYISAEGLVFPCCYVSNIYRINSTFNVEQVLTLIDDLPEKSNSLSAKINSLDQIISNRFFQQTIPESWSKESFKEGKLYTCARTCGNYKLCVSSEVFKN